MYPNFSPPSLSATIMSSETSSFFTLTDDLVLKIFSNLEDNPTHWSRLACVSTKFSSLIRNSCWKNKCIKAIPSIVSDLLPSSSDEPQGGWASLHKLSVCCPGLHHAGVLLENSDFGLERELGPNEDFHLMGLPHSPPIPSTTHQNCISTTKTIPSPDCTSWSLYDDLYFDTVYDISEAQNEPLSPEELGGVVVIVGSELSVSATKKKKKRKTHRSTGTHLVSGVWNLSREQGNKLLASRFRGDCLYVCHWPGCMHAEDEKRGYMLFRGVFKDFKRTKVWRSINDGNRSRITLDCAFCGCNETWDLHSAFCLRRVFGYHDNGEPVVRAYVCENGHVSGAWTDQLN